MLVVGAVAWAAERDDAIGVVAATVLAWHDVCGIDGLAPADKTVTAANLRALGLRSRDERKRPHRTAPQRRTAPHAAERSPA